VLIAVLIVVVILSLAGYHFNELMTTEFQAATNDMRVLEVKALADSGVHYAAALLGDPNTLSGTLNNNLFDNPSAFRDQVVGGGDAPGRFSIVSPLEPDAAATGGGNQPYRFGFSDESGKINLNALLTLDSSGQVGHDLLMQLPNMTDDIANCILDWLDPDSDPRTNGAEDDYYSSLSPPVHCKNGPLDSLEELLLVKGVTPDLLFGTDQRRTGLAPDGSLADRGWSAYLTIYSREQNIDSQGNPRIYLNSSDLQTLQANLTSALDPDLAAYIIAYRQYGPAASQSQGGGPRAPSAPPDRMSMRPTGPSAPGGRQTMGPQSRSSNAPQSRSSMGPSAPTPIRGSSGGGGMGGSGAGGSGGGGGGGGGGGRGQKINSVFDLINSSVTIPGENGQQGTTMQSPLSDPNSLAQFLPQLLDKTTTTQDTELPGRINVMTASQAVLSGLPGISATDVQSIISSRPDPTAVNTSDPIYQTPAWLVTQAQMQPSTVKRLEKYITSRSQVYRMQVIGYRDGGGPTARVEAVIDANNQRPRIVYWRNLTELGKGFDLSQ
jgi:DNA uptake protein ComE-like DNA-binding protein